MTETSLSHRNRSTRFGEAARLAACRVATLLGSPGNSVTDQTLASLLPRLSTGAPQHCPVGMWKEVDFSFFVAERRRRRPFEGICTIFKHNVGMPYGSRTWHACQASVHTCSTILSRCGVESRDAASAGSARPMASDNHGAPAAASAHILSRPAFALLNKGLGEAVRLLSTIHPQHCPCRVWTCRRSGWQVDGARHRGLPRGGPRVRVAPVFLRRPAAVLPFAPATRGVLVFSIIEAAGWPN